MGRGLSPLQRWILEHTAQKGRLYYAEICEGYFGWPLQYPWLKPRPDHPEWTYSMGQRFNADQIGPREYQRGRATLARSVSRLVQRGLITRWRGVGYTRVELTDDGRK